METIGQGGPRAPGSSLWPPPEAVLEALSRRLTPELIDGAIRATGRCHQRLRRIHAASALWLVIGLGVFADLDIPSVWRQVVGTLRSLWRAGGRPPPSKSALAQARQRLGARPLRRLFRLSALPLATPTTPGAFFHGLRLVVIDAVSLDLPDTPTNRAAFGASSNRTNDGRLRPGAYPRLTLCVLNEAATHFILEAFVRPFKADECAAGMALLDRVPAGSLVLWDRRYYSRPLLDKAIRLGIHILGRVGSQAVFRAIRTLSDGSTLAVIPQRDRGRNRPGDLTVRVIRYTIADPARAGCGEEHRLVTTLLDAQKHPAHDLIVLYHERWEIEIANDEVKTHQLLTLRPTALRSQTPAGAVQEVYGLLLTYNAVRALMAEAANLDPPIDPRRLGFTHALRVIREAIPHLRAAEARRLPALFEAMVRHIRGGPIPPRADRVYPRVVKCKMSHFLTKRPEHLHPPQPNGPFRSAFKVLN